MKKVENIIIDSHVHIGKTEKTERFFSLKSYHELIMEMENCIYGSVVMPNLSNIVKSSTLNMQFIEEYSKWSFPVVFYPLLVIDPKDSETLKQISLYNDIICGLKYHPSISETTFDVPEMDDFLECAAEFSLPILVHCGRHWRSDIKYLIDAAKRFKTINFIAAHLGGNAADLIERAIDLLYIERLDNVYLDTSSVKLPWLIEKAVDKLGKRKIIFGSDEPYADLRMAIYCINLSNITDEVKNGLFYENVLTIYGRLNHV